MSPGQTFFRILLLLLLAVNAGAQTFYRTPSGKKYHLASCRMVEHTSAAVSPRAAGEAGLTACSFCKPGELRSTPAAALYRTPVGAAASRQTQTVLCRGITKSGARCRHRTSIADGYCYQHRPG